MKDWTGSRGVIRSMNATKSYDERAKHDFYATEPKAMELLLEHETFNKNVWECACGQGHLSEVLKKQGYDVLSTDLIERGYEDYTLDFLTYNGGWKGDIVTNPPYRKAKEFTLKALDTVAEGNKVAMFLKITFLESKGRQELFEKHPPRYVYISRARLSCVRNGEFNKYPTSAVAYAWFIWEKGYKGEPTIRWFN